MKTRQELLKALTDCKNNVRPIPIMGHDDSIYLTDRQEGYRDGLQKAIELVQSMQSEVSK